MKGIAKAGIVSWWIDWSYLPFNSLFTTLVRQYESAYASGLIVLDGSCLRYNCSGSEKKRINPSLSSSASPRLNFQFTCYKLLSSSRDKGNESTTSLMHGYDFKMAIAEGRIVLHPTSSNVSDKEIPIDICLLFTFWGNTFI